MPGDDRIAEGGAGGRRRGRKDVLLPVPPVRPRPHEASYGYNSMSRRFDVYICEFCGLDEAVRDSRREDPLDVHEWGMISGIENGDLDAENDEYREKREEER